MNAVQMLVAVWIFTTLGQADDEFIVRCEDVTGSVGKKVTFTCRVSLQQADCCIINYKFQYPKRYNDSTICRGEVTGNSCDQRNRFTCSFTPTTAMIEQFRFFIQANCATKTTKLHMNITETINPEIINEVINPEILNEVINPEKPEEHAWDVSSEQKKAEDRGFRIAIITAAVSSLIIIIVPIIYRITHRHPKRKTLLVFRHDGDEGNHPENVI